MRHASSDRQSTTDWGQSHDNSDRVRWSLQWTSGDSPAWPARSVPSQAQVSNPSPLRTVARARAHPAGEAMTAPSTRRSATPLIG